MNILSKTASAFLLRTTVVLLGLGVLAFLLLEPWFEGVNANAAGFVDVYLDDPFLAYAYMASVPFFAALLQLWKVLGYAGRNELSSTRSVKALRTLRYCASVMPVLIAIGVVWLLSVETDDRPPIVMMGMITMFISVSVAIAAGVLEKKVRG